METAPSALARVIEADLDQPVPPGTHALVARLRERYGTAIRGILLYGSCLRRQSDEGVVDLYVLVDDYGSAYAGHALALLNRLLPPNVFYLEAHAGDQIVRAKYAVLSLSDLTRGTTAETFEPYFWARFAQPCALVYAVNAAVRREVVSALSTAVVTMVRRGLPLVGPRFDARELWTTTWHETYRTELRAERPGVVEGLWTSAAPRYIEATRLALAALPYATTVEDTGGDPCFTVQLPDGIRRLTQPLWLLRRIHGKTRFLARLLRNALIFEGGVEYALWKIQRHSGIATDSEWRKHRYPLLALGAHAWRLYRAGAFR